MLEELGVPYFIGGSLAGTLHGTVRTTQRAKSPGCGRRDGMSRAPKVRPCVRWTNSAVLAILSEEGRNGATAPQACSAG